MIKRVGVAILGLGVVGGGTYKLLTENREFYQKTQEVDIEVESVLVRDKQHALKLGIPEERVASNIAEVIANPAVDIVIECIGGAEAAKDYVLAALHEGKTVVTSNKELICKYSHELERTARRNCCGLYFEASCVGGVPVIRTLLDGVQSNQITEMMGIINGTTNYILTKMANENEDYATALQDAQRLGYAETDPTNDVEGIDAVYKLAILSSLAFHTKVPYTKIFRKGIANVDKADIAYGKELGYTLKLLAIGKNTDRGIEARVHPTFIKNSHPLSGVGDCYNAVYFKGNAMDDIMLYGRGAGAMPTASAVVSDVIYAATHTDVKYSTFKNNATADRETKFATDFESAYYLRLSAADEAGVLAKVSGIFAKYGISIVELVQKGTATTATGEGRVPLILVTHITTESAIRNAVNKINISGIADVKAVIRVEA
jgi:homoserine dehydrogenase